MDNVILYDWLTVSFSNVDKDTLIHLLGLQSLSWSEADTGSRLRYGHRLYYDGISIHYTDDWDRKHNQGICLEMSGQGCRDYETFGKGDWWLLFDFIRLSKAKVTRLDLAYDDYTGLILLPIMAEMARKFMFTARSQKVRVIEEAEDANPDHLGISVCHGSKSSDLYIRVYDKRVERHAWDIPHWVRFEIQLRNNNCDGFISNGQDLGEKFRGVVSNYLNYRCPEPSDTNKRRWHVAPWWQKFLAGAAAISIHTTKDIEYNRDRLEAHVYERNHNAIKTAILSSGLPQFLEKTFGRSEELPDKYKKVLQASENAAEIERILNETTGLQMVDLIRSAEDWADYHAINLFQVV